MKFIKWFCLISIFIGLMFSFGCSKGKGNKDDNKGNDSNNTETTEPDKNTEEKKDPEQDPNNNPNQQNGNGGETTVPQGQND